MKRRRDRREHRKGAHQPHHTPPLEAQEDTQEWQRENLCEAPIPYEEVTKVATYNAASMVEAGKREAVEQYMIEHDIKVLALTETRVMETHIEKRDNAYWYFSGEDKKDKQTYAGVALVVRHDHTRNVRDIQPQGGEGVVDGTCT